MTDQPLRTRWRVVRVLDPAERPVTGLDIELVVDTTAPTVVRAIERAATAAGIVLSRLRELDDEPAS